MTLITANLRPLLLADAATCVASGLLMTLGASFLADLLQLPAELLFESGLALFPIALFIAAVAARASDVWLAVAAVAAGNLAWVLASVWVVAGGVFAPNAFGAGFVLVQAVAVLAFALAEGLGAMGLRGELQHQG